MGRAHPLPCLLSTIRDRLVVVTDMMANFSIRNGKIRPGKPAWLADYNFGVYQRSICGLHLVG